VYLNYVQCTSGAPEPNTSLRYLYIKERYMLQNNISLYVSEYK